MGGRKLGSIWASILLASVASAGPIKYRTGSSVVIIPNTGQCPANMVLRGTLPTTGELVCVTAGAQGEPGPPGPAGPPGPPGPAGSGGGIDTTKPLTIQQAIRLGRPEFLNALVDCFIGDNQPLCIVVRSIYTELTPPMQREWRGAIAFAASYMPYGEDGSVVVGPAPSGYPRTFVAFAGWKMQPPSEVPNVQVIPMVTNPYFGPGQCYGFAAGYRVESTGGLTVPGPTVTKCCPSTTGCRFLVDFPHGACTGNMICTPTTGCQWYLCVNDTQCAQGTFCEFVRSDSGTAVPIYIGGQKQYSYQSLYGELKFPGDALSVWNFNERRSASPYDTTGDASLATYNPGADWAPTWAANTNACVQQAVLPVTTIPGDPWYEVTGVRCTDITHCSGCDPTPGVCSSYATTPPVFRDDFKDSCDTNGNSVRKKGWRHTALVSAAPPGKHHLLCVTADGNGTHVTSCR